MTALTDYLNPTCLRQHRFILFFFWKPELWRWISLSYSQGADTLVPSGSSRGESAYLYFLTSLVHDLFLTSLQHFASLVTSPVFSLVKSPTISLLQGHLGSYLGPTWIIQDNSTSQILDHICNVLFCHVRSPSQASRIKVWTSLRAITESLTLKDHLSSHSRAHLCMCLTGPHSIIKGWKIPIF
jgi:hypothetical protein